MKLLFIYSIINTHVSDSLFIYYLLYRYCREEWKMKIN